MSKVKLFTETPNSISIDVEKIYDVANEFISRNRTMLYTTELDVVSFKGAFEDVNVSIRYKDAVLVDIDVDRHSISLWANIAQLIEAPHNIKSYVLELLETLAKTLETPHKDSIEIITQWLKQKTQHHE